MDPDLRRVFILVLLTPLLALVSSDLRGIIFIAKDDTWNGANKYCRLLHSGLLTIRDAAHEATLEGEGWVGLKRPDGVWKWAGGEPLGDLRWVADDEPRDGNKCAKWKIGGLKSELCQDEMKFFCATNDLVLITEEKTWEEALQHCRDLPHRLDKCYDLVTLETHDDYVFAKEEAKKAKTNEVWTGLRYLSTRWFWVGDRDKASCNTLPACPDQNNTCGSMSGTSLDLQTRNCMEKKNFFCQRRECVEGDKRSH